MSLTITFRSLLAVLGLAVMSGCSTLSAITDVTTPLAVYELRPPADIPAAPGRPLPLDIVIELPTTSGTLETDRIMIRPDALQAQYLPEVRWSDETPVMVQTLMLRAVEATGGVRYVGRRPLGASGDFAVVSELIDFQAELDPEGDGATIRLRLIARMVREEDASIVASRTFSAEARTLSSDTDPVIRAFDAANAILIKDFAAWVLSSARNG